MQTFDRKLRKKMKDEVACLYMDAVACKNLDTAMKFAEDKVREWENVV